MVVYASRTSVSFNCLVQASCLNWPLAGVTLFPTSAFRDAGLNIGVATCEEDVGCGIQEG